MDQRFDKIRKLLAAYSIGNFDKKLSLSSRMDEVDAFISGVNMLGEELKERTISRDYFNNIFNSVSDMVFVLNETGRIENINRSVTSHLLYNLDDLKGKSIHFLTAKPGAGWFNLLVKDLRNSRKRGYETLFRTRDDHPIPVLVSASILEDAGSRKPKVLLAAKDITIQKETQNMMLKVIIETEEKERARFAKDLHDSIGQQLSAIKFYIGTSAGAVQDSRQKSILLKANAALLDVQADMRNICFNIMPKSLELFGLVKAVEELCSKLELQGKMQINRKMSRNFPKLPVQQGFAIFRIIQEFINNALKHSKADTLRIVFSYVKKTARITLSDNGVGFDLQKLQHRGMGLSNVVSRMLPYNGEVNIISRPGKGTRYEISFPADQKE